MKLIRPVAMLCALGITVGGTVALAASQGSQEDPLITLSYLQQVLTPQLEEKVDAAVADNEKALVDKLDASIAGYEARAKDAQGSAAAPFQSKSLSRGEKFTPGAGRELLVVSGSLTAVGSLTDTTAGKSVSSGAALELNHCYLTADDASGCQASAAASVMSR